MSIIHTPEDTTNDSTDLDAIASLLLEEVGEVNAGRKDKRRQDAPPTDDEVAFDLFANELTSLLSVIQDQRMARSMEAAVNTDSALIGELEQSNTRTLEDRSIAVRMQRGEEVFRPPSVPPRRISVEGIRNRVQISRVPWELEQSNPRALEDSSTAVRLQRGEEVNAECAFCMDATEISDIVFPCQHTYHVACAVGLFEAAIKDESLMPPRCCRIPIPDTLVIPHLSTKSAALFLEKSQEHRTSNRLYCPEPSCSQFLGAARKERVNVRCKCSRLVCAVCKSFAHPGDVPCSLDTDSQQVLDLAKSEGWQRCPGCSHMVELAHGCYHMTCLCRTQFCYLCRELWKNCPCAQWNEERLMVAAEHQVENRIAHEPRFRRDREELVLRAAEVLRNDHECAHPSWNLRKGGAQCENCRNYMPHYILCCTTCQMFACVPCQRNRL
ncbi:hypothetical protein JB92DRAFT_2704628 [Gautieria morchelliformis]|nr:hypothetical protein JB92DRAFT_2704628 [Gautieria morchelliformis]